MKKRLLSVALVVMMAVLAKYQSYSHNFWIGIFYPRRAFDGLEFIDLQSIKMRD